MFGKRKRINDLENMVLDLEAKMSSMRYDARLLQIFIDDQFPGLFLADKNYVVNSITLKQIYREIGMIR